MNPRLLMAVTVLCCGMVLSSPCIADTYSFGVVPQQASSKLARLWGPLLAYLGEKTGLELRFETAPNIPEFEQRVRDGGYDFAYMNPYHYVVFSEKPGFRAFAREKGKRLQGIIVVRKDSPVRSIQELQGSTVAFPAPAAFAATILPLAEFRRDGIVVNPKYVSSHDSVYLAVARGLYPAGGGITRTLDSVAPELRDQLRVLWTTGPYTPHAFAAHPRVPKAVVERLAAAMTAMHADPAGRQLLAPLAMDALEGAADEDWGDVRALDIRLLAPLLRE